MGALAGRWRGVASKSMLFCPWLGFFLRLHLSLVIVENLAITCSGRAAPWPSFSVYVLRQLCRSGDVLYQ